MFAPVSVLAVIPYTTYPDFEIGPLTVRAFGLLVGLGVILGATLAARYIERFGVPRDETFRFATRVVIAGLIGSRVTWVLSHLDQIDSPIDIIAVWEGGIQFSGGFIAGVIVGFPGIRKLSPKLRWRSVDGYLYGLTAGLAIGRIGCYSVGEHFGRASDFFLATRYDGGGTQEPVPLPGGELVSDTDPRAIGASFHNTSLYELMHLSVLFVVLTLLLRRAKTQGRELAPGTIVGVFTIWYGVGRFLTDFTRVNDETVAGLTGAQFMTLAMIPAGLWILFRVRHLVAAEPENPAEIAEIRARAMARAGVVETTEGVEDAADTADAPDDDAAHATADAVDGIDDDTADDDTPGD